MENLKNGTKIKNTSNGIVYFFSGTCIMTDTYLLLQRMSDREFAKHKFKILSEEDEEIDIQSIEKLDEFITRRNGEVTQTEGKILDIANKTNELLKAIKQLDLKIKEK